MSIIFEALKKVSGEKLGAKAETAVKRPQEEAAPHVLNQKAPGLSRGAFVILAVIIGAILLSSVILKGRGASGLKPSAQPKAEMAASSPAEKPPAAGLISQGYSPPQPLPKKETVASAIFKPKPLKPRLTLSGIICGLGTPTAIIDDKIVEEGESVKGAKVIKIYSSHVELLDERSGEPFILKAR